MKRWLTAISGCLAAVAVLSAQQPPQFRSGIELVELDVSVLDKDRRPVRGLTALDFMVLEDGQPQEIVSVGEIDVAEPIEAPTAWMREVAPDVRANLAASERLIVIVMDDAQVRMSPVTTKAVREIGRRLVDRLGPNDLAAVVFTRNNSGAQPFTSDRARLLAAVEKFSGGFGGATDQGDWSAEYFFQSSLRTLQAVADGSVYFDVDVPDFSKGEVKMSGVVLNATPNVPVAPADALARLIPIVPTARREFWQNDRVTAFLRIYQPGQNPAAVLLTARVRDSADRTVFERTDSVEAEVFVKDRSAEYRVELPI